MNTNHTLASNFRHAHHLREISSFANAVMRLSPEDEIGVMARAIANAAARLELSPEDDGCKSELVASVCALSLALSVAPRERNRLAD